MRHPVSDLISDTPKKCSIHLEKLLGCFRYNSLGYGDVRTLILNPISSFYLHNFKYNTSRTCVRSKDNMNDIGVMPMFSRTLGLIKTKYEEYN